MFDVANWVACLNGENDPRGTPSHEALSVSPQQALELSSVIGQPPSFDRNHFSTSRVVAESHKRDERTSVKPISVGCYGQLNSSSLHKQTRRNPLGRDVRSPVEDHDLVPSLADNLKSQTHSRVSECGGGPSVQVEPSPVNRMVTASAGVQTDLSKVVHSSCRSICHLFEPQSSTVRISRPRPKYLGHRCSEHKLVGSHCLCLPSYGSPSQGDPKNQAIQLPDHCNSPRLARDALVLGPSAVLH